MKQQIQFKKKLISFSEIIFIVAFSIFLYLAKFDNIYLNIISLLLTAHAIVVFFKRFNDQKPKIIFSKKGVQFCSKDRFEYCLKTENEIAINEDTILNWKEITYIYIHTKSHNNEKYDLPYILVKTGNREITDDIYEYNYSIQNINEFVEYYWGQKPATLNQHILNEIGTNARGNLQTINIIETIKKYKSTHKIVVVLLFLTIPLWGYLQYKTSFAYCFAIGTCITCLARYWFQYFHGKHLLTKPYFKDLYDFQVNELEEDFNINIISHQLIKNNLIAICIAILFLTIVTNL